MSTHNTAHASVGRVVIALTLTAFLGGVAIGALLTGGRVANEPALVSIDRTAGASATRPADAAPARDVASLPAAPAPQRTMTSPPSEPMAPLLATRPAPATLASRNAGKPEIEAEEVIVRRGDTLMNILARAGIERAEAHEVVSTLETVYDPRKLRVGQYLALELDRSKETEPKLAGLSISLDFEKDLRLERGPDGDLSASTVERELIRTTHAASGTIRNSFYLDGRRNDVPDEALWAMMTLFSWDVDFQRDVQPGDSFEIVYDMVTTPDGRDSRADAIRYAALDIGGRTLRAYRFKRDDGRVGYFDETGRSLRKWLMRTPIDGARLSSGFGRRKHPVLGYTKMHKGTDFAAPRGTPVYAAGDGTIVSIGRNGSYGNYIRIRHNSEYSTAYAHLNGFAKSLKKGSRVSQGDVIGYVGTTGRSTGPHLHYEVLKNGTQINPLKIKAQNSERLSGGELVRFQQEIGVVNVMRETAGKTVIARGGP